MAIQPLEQSEMIDFSALLTAINDEKPSGEDPRRDASPSSLYYLLKNVRNNVRTEERNALIEGDPLLSFASQWQPLLDQVPEILTTQSKDLEYTAWFIEALVRNHGYAGLSYGFAVAKLLIDEFWDSLYPLPDEDGVETRVAPLIGLNGIEGEGTLLMPIACIPITEFDGDQAYALWEYEQACELERFDDNKKRHRIDQGSIDIKRVVEAVKHSSPSFYRGLVEDIENSISAYEALVVSMDQATGLSLPTSHISKRLQSALESVQHIAADKLLQGVPEEVGDVSNDGEFDDKNTDSQSEKFAARQFKTRQEAIVQLKHISVFFRKTEPHSPMSYAIDQVVRWSDLALPDLLAELIDDGSARKGYFRLVGISSENDTAS